MSQKVKVLVSVLAVVVLLTVGSVATVMAQEEPTPAPEESTKGLLATAVEPQIEPGKSFDNVGDNTTAGLLARVAEKLGISEEELVNAFKQAQQEMREEAFFKALDKAVEKGRLTEPEAKAIKEWWQQRPEIMAKGLFPRAAFGIPALGGGPMGGWRGGHMRGGHKGWCSPRPPEPAD